MRGIAENTFLTERLPLAIYLHASAKLEFSHCETTSNSKVRFVFRDLQHIGCELELEFERGAQVPATAIFASQKFLRRKMSEALNNRKTGEYFVDDPHS
jgi:hypothetical protein